MRNTLISWSSDSADYTRQSSHFSPLECDVSYSNFYQGVDWPGTTLCGNSLLTYASRGHLNKRKNWNVGRSAPFSNLASCSVWAHGVCSRPRETGHWSFFVVRQWQVSSLAWRRHAFCLPQIILCSHLGKLLTHAPWIMAAQGAHVNQFTFLQQDT